MKALGPEGNFLAIDEKFSAYEDSQIVILQAPYEHTVSYGGGTEKGPKGILEASAFVEFYDDETDKELCFEKGIATLEPIDFKGQKDAEALALIEKEVRKAIIDGKFVVTLGGEHTISSAPIRAHFDKYPDMCVLQIDAHSDLRDTYQGSKYSHASVMARVAEFIEGPRINQVGIRALCKEEREFMREKAINTYFSSAVRRGVHGKEWQKEVVKGLSDNIYITFDVDGLDPSIMPSTGTPEPDGLFYAETIQLFREIKRAGKKIIGLDIVELAPVEGVAHPDLTTARLLYKILNLEFYT